MEIAVVSSAMYGLVISTLICGITVAVFTGHVILLIIILLTIFGKCDIQLN